MPIPVARPDLNGNEATYVLDAIKKEDRISSSGKYLERFERMAAERFNRRFALSTSNGTTALHLALLGLGIGPGDEVIVPTFTFAASVATIVQCGATPVFIDAKRDDWTLNPDELEALRTTRTKALVAVDLYGMPCDYQKILDWCQMHEILLVEDAAEAHGASYDEKPVGSFGNVSCFSFFGNKIITTGEGGMCLTDDPELAERMRVLKSHGMKRPSPSDYEFEHHVVGYNYRMTNLQAAIGVAQLERFDQFLATRKEHENLYRELLRDVPGVTFQTHDTIKQPVNWLFTVQIEKDVHHVITALQAAGIESRPTFKPMHLQTPYRRYADGRSFPVAEQLHQHGLSLPSSNLLSTDEIRTVCDTLKNILALV